MTHEINVLTVVADATAIALLTLRTSCGSCQRNTSPSNLKLQSDEVMSAFATATATAPHRASVRRSRAKLLF